MRAKHGLLILAAGVAAGLAITRDEQALTLPNQPASVKFAAMGDNGTGEPPEYETADQICMSNMSVP
jgi:hypothetical protein